MMMDSVSDLFTPAPDVLGYPAAFSPDRRYRYALWRHWGSTKQPRYLMVIGLNPSTADESADDPTIRRCVGFARIWGFDALCMTNLFAFRATNPKVMKAQPDPVGPENTAWLVALAPRAGMILAAWGTGGGHLKRANVVRRIFRDARWPLHALRITKNGLPYHPLYIPGDALPISFE